MKPFGPLGWEPYCKLRQAEALDASGKQSEALKVLETLKDYPNVSPRNEADLSAAYEHLVKIYANIKAWDKGLISESGSLSPDFSYFETVICH